MMEGVYASYKEPIAGDASFGVDLIVDSQEKAPMGGSLCEKGRRGSHVEEDGARGGRWEEQMGDEIEGRLEGIGS